MSRERDVRWVSVDDLEADPMNPQKQDVTTFNELVDAIKRNGILETLVVKPLPTGKLRIVAGEHRWKAARMAGVERVPVMIAEDWDEDEARMEMVRMNVLRGKLDGKKFVELYNELEKKYGQEALQKRMGFANREGEFRRLAQQTAKSIGGDVGRELSKRAEKIRSVEDLHAVVQEVFTRYGDTLSGAHFVTFAFGGATHLMVQCTSRTFAPIRALASRCAEEGLPLDEELARLAGGEESKESSDEDGSGRTDGATPDEEPVGARVPDSGD